jgi:hypothetical protein
MPISEAQLQTWSGHGATAGAKATHESVRTALEGATRLNGRSVEIYLQGSYRNDTNVRGDSDVDIVVQLNSTVGHDISRLSPQELGAFSTSYSDADYLWNHFRDDVLLILRNYYGNDAVTAGNKCLTVAAGGGRLHADVVPAIEYRVYSSFIRPGLESYASGIRFHEQPSGRTIINYPKLHYEAGVAKNGAAGGYYKPAVRLFKNTRTVCVEQGLLADGVAPSYFLECLLHTVPTNLFQASLQDTYADVVNYLHGSSFAGFTCQNGQTPLFGPTPEQWGEGRARQLIGALAQLWNNWRR